MEYKIFISSNANRMINKHIDFLELVSVDSTIKLKMLISDSLIILKHFPKIGSKVKTNDELPVYYRKLVISRKYLLIYYTDNKKIYIDAVLDCRQNNEKYL